MTPVLGFALPAMVQSTVVPPPITTTITQNPALPKTAVTTVSSTSQKTILHSNNRKLCLLKAAVANVSSYFRPKANILFDEGSQRSFMSQSLANTLQLQPLKKETVVFASQTQHLQVAKIYLETKTGTKLPLSVLTVPTIAAPLQTTVQSITTHQVTILTTAYTCPSEREFKLEQIITGMSSRQPYFLVTNIYEIKGHMVTINDLLY